MSVMQHTNGRRGPLEYLVIECPGAEIDDTIIQALQAIVAHDTLRIIDLLFLKKDADGVVTTLECDDLSPTELPSLRALDGEITGLFSAEDAQREGDHLAANMFALLVLVEHTWALGLQAVITHAQGTLIVDEHIPQTVVDNALTYAATIATAQPGTKP